ncbi:MAG: M18 family aminopeptidase [Pseudomonadota bacterium]
MKNKQFNQALCQFLDASPTPFHATTNLLKILTDAGFKEINESDDWRHLNKGKYVVTRNDSSLIAFNLSAKKLSESGFHMVGAHTDSPCLKVKPNAEVIKQDYLQLGVEVYGGALLNPWFDRDLSLAGRISYEAIDGSIKSKLINFCLPIAIIPSLAIHLDREANKKRSINAQTDILPILLQGFEKTEVVQSEKSEQDIFSSILKKQLKKQYPKIKLKKILAHELSFYDTQAAALIGIQQDFISSSRLDNLLSCFIGAQALINSNFKHSSLLVCNDHEEVGSQSTSGAQGNFLLSVLQRLCKDNETLLRCTHQSLLVSADNAHGIHPNYSDKHDKNHGPILNQGPVIKINANQRYASNSESIAIFQKYANDLDINIQKFVVRSDMGCGSTIGPLIASLVGVKTVDIGLATFAMHSIREVAGSQDPYLLYKILNSFFSNKK